MPYSGRFPKRGMMRSGSIFAPPTWERRTVESDSSSSRGGETWATAQAHDAKGAPGATAQERGGFQASLAAQVMWPTPSAGLHNDAEDPASWLARAEALKAKHSNGNGAGMPLAVAAKLSRWPTPNAAKASSDTSLMCSGDGRETPNKLGWAVAITQGSARPTPAARDFKDTGTSPSEFERNTPGLAARAGGSLNPAWVEQLMGFPAGWTSPLTNGPSVPAKRNPKGSHRGSRKTARSVGNG